MAAFVLKACELKEKILKVLHVNAGRGAAVPCSWSQSSARHEPVPR